MPGGYTILGIDPGSRLTGYACIHVQGKKISHLASGTLRLGNTSSTDAAPLDQRLRLLFESLSKVFTAYRPDYFVVEKIFFAKNALSALKLGHSRGVVLLCGAMAGARLVEYSATEVKKAVTGYGRSDKDQVAKAVQWMTGVREFESADASDALALALCHAHCVGAASQVKSLQKNSGKRGFASSVAHLVDD